eukprot:TRINITY_DN601_c0_g1_i4.p2 TRINITY_DN601_c0_g1~~TRINITY_DN601_c0_g1_i4.p2  ORF type:complete len:107 (-),score=18.14 TRINITY_DN601_c0_g1_i4:644-964(-)
MTVLTSKNRNELSVLQALDANRRQRQLRFSLKWRHLSSFNALMRLPQYRRPGTEDITQLGNLFTKACVEAGTGPEIYLDLVKYSNFHLALMLRVSLECYLMKMDPL